MQAKIITPTCKFDCEMVISLDASGEHLEVRKIYDESIRLNNNRQTIFVSISDFKNAKCETIGEFLLNNHDQFVSELVQSD